MQAIDFVHVPSRDVVKATHFYRDTLGLHQTGGDEGKWAEFDVGGLVLTLWRPEDFGVPFQPLGGIAFQVNDVAYTIEQLRAKGVQFFSDVVDTTICHMAFFQDLDGNLLILHHRYVPEG